MWVPLCWQQTPLNVCLWNYLNYLGLWGWPAGCDCAEAHPGGDTRSHGGNSGCKDARQLRQGPVPSERTRYHGNMQRRPKGSKGDSSCGMDTQSGTRPRERKEPPRDS